MKNANLLAINVQNLPQSSLNSQVILISNTGPDMIAKDHFVQHEASAGSSMDIKSNLSDSRISDL